MRTPLTVAALLLTALWLAGAPSVAAHDETGVIEVVATRAGPLTESYEVDVTYLNDGHGAVDATVTVTVVAEGPGGALVGPVAMAAKDPEGRYTASLVFPVEGDWAVRFSSLSPLATAEVQETLGVPGTPSPSPATDDDGGEFGAGTVVFVGTVLAMALIGVIIAVQSRRNRGRR